MQSYFFFFIEEHPVLKGMVHFELNIFR